MKQKILVLIFMLIILISAAVLAAGCFPAETLPVESESPIEIYAPASTSSIPVLLAASQNENIHVTLYSNQSQANALFLRGEIPMLVTGLSVGQDMYAQDVPVQISNSFVAGLSYLVTYGEPITGFADLAGAEVYVPFEGSPIEDICAYFAAQAGLVWGEDITPIYAPFDSSLALLKEGQARAVVLPEPFVSLVEGQPGINVSISFYDVWNQYNPQADGYPQVGTFVNREWALTHAREIAFFNQALADAIAAVEADPNAAVTAVSSNYKFPEAVLLKSLSRIAFDLRSGADMQTLVEQYDEITGNPANENETDFYYLP